MGSSNYVGGYRYDLEDRDWLIQNAMSNASAMKALAAAELPPEVDPTTWFEIRNQGQEGSCFPAGAKVTMADGSLKNIEDVKVGDQVVSGTRCPRRVTHVMKRDYSGEMVQVFVKGWGKITMTGDRTVLVVRGEEEQWIQAADLRETDCLIVSLGPLTKIRDGLHISDHVSNIDCYHPDGSISVGSSTPIPNQLELDSLTLQVFGLYAAEGSVEYVHGAPRRVSWSLNDTTKKPQAAKVKRWIERLGLHAQVQDDPSQHKITVRVNSPILAELFANEIGRYANLKCVPYFVCEGSDEQKYEFLRGYFSGYGSRTKLENGRVAASGNVVTANQISVCTASRVLAQQVATLLTSLRLKPGRSLTKKRSHQNHNSYQTYLFGQEALDFSKVECTDRKTRASSAKWSAFGQVRKIREIVRKIVDSLPVFDFTVDIDHSFVAQGLIVHNCQGHAISAAGEDCYRIASHGNLTRFSSDAAYYLTQKIDGLLGGDNGSTIAGGMKMAMDIGFIPEQSMPYTDRYNPQDLPKNYAELGAPFRVKGHIVLEGPDFFAQAVQWIGSGAGACTIGIPWGVNLDEKGFVHWTGGGGGGHANAILGYGGPKDSDGLPQFLWDANSWSKSWGPLKGFCKWTRDMFNKAMAHRYSVGIGISDMSQVKPRRRSWKENFPA